MRWVQVRRVKKGLELIPISRHSDDYALEAWERQITQPRSDFRYLAVDFSRIIMVHPDVYWLI